MKGSARALLAISGLVLLGTAALHGSGFPQVTALLATSGIDAAWAGGMRGLWLIYALHLGIVGIIVLAAAAKPEVASRGLLIALGLIPALDALVLLSTIGVFPGNVLLTIAALGIFVGAVLRTEPSDVAVGALL